MLEAKNLSIRVIGGVAQAAEDAGAEWSAHHERTRIVDVTVYLPPTVRPEDFARTLAPGEWSRLSSGSLYRDIEGVTVTVMAASSGEFIPPRKVTL